MIIRDIPFFENLEVQKEALDAHTIVSVTDTRGTIIYANERFCETSGYSRDELIGAKHNIINSGYHSKGFFRDLWGKLNKGETWKGEIKNKCKDGDYYWVKSTIIPIVDQTNGAKQYIAVRTDITHQKEAELYAQEESLRKTKFLSSVSHELRTPLNAIKGFCQLLATENFDQKTTEYLDLILKSSQSLERQISSLLEYGNYRERSLNIQTVKLELLFKKLEDTFYSQLEVKKLSFKICVEPYLLVDTDKSYLTMILENLIANSIKYTPEGGEICIKARLEKSHIIISVVDNGTGIPEGSENKIYNRFERLNHAGSTIEGNGLGLCLVKELIDTIHGSIGYKSKPNIGTEFFLSLPLINSGRE